VTAIFFVFNVLKLFALYDLSPFCLDESIIQLETRIENTQHYL